MLRTRMTTFALILSELFPLDGFRCNFVSALLLENALEYFYDTSLLCRKGHENVSHKKWQLLLSYFLSYFPLIISDAISCPLYNLKTLRNIIKIHHSYVEQVKRICRVQK